PRGRWPSSARTLAELRLDLCEQLSCPQREDGDPVPAAPARFLMRNDDGEVSVPAVPGILWTTPPPYHTTLTDQRAELRKQRVQLHDRSWTSPDQAT
ncbi:hypothetical protein, partial [Lentzea albidocapillata]|uniref:hypothetical protein n=1 Tax=Lentzea albidocapillata TaxID=40571 RepID=UPI001C201327